MDENWTQSSYCHTSSCCVQVWRKSTFCTDNACVEVGVWKKSTKSGPWTDNCVEVAGWQNASLTDNTCVEVDLQGPLDEVLVRDSKDPDGPVLHFTPDEWRAFIKGAKDGEFDLP